MTISHLTSIHMLKLGPHAALHRNLFTRLSTNRRKPWHVKQIQALKGSPSIEPPRKTAVSHRATLSGGNATTSKHPSSMAAAADAVRQRLELCVMAEAEEQRGQMDKAYSRASDSALIREGIALTGTPRSSRCISAT